MLLPCSGRGLMNGERLAPIARVYLGVHDRRSFDACIVERRLRTGAKLALVAATDPADTRFVDLRMRGATASRRADCIADYQAHL